MGVGEILQVLPDSAFTLGTNNVENRKSAIPLSASKATSESRSDQTVTSESDAKDNKKSDQIKHTIQNLLGGNSELSISVDQQTRDIVVKVLNSETHEVIRQIPPEEALRLAHSLKKVRGALVDEVA
jgi:flagellar protein FlaG